MAALEQYKWMPITCFVVAFFTAFGMGTFDSGGITRVGANDVSNSFATAVGSKALTMKQACMIAAVMEFSGSFLLGGNVASTIMKGITDPKYFVNDPQVLMFGMVCVLFSVAVWLILATMKGLPVSTTHSCIGGIIGMTVVCKGFEAVNWKGVGMVFSSWIIAPVVSGILSSFLFVAVRKAILRAANSLQRAFKSYSPIVGFTIGFNIFLILYNSESLGIDLPMYMSALICLGIAITVSLVVRFTALPYIRRHVEAEGTIGLLSEYNDVLDISKKDGVIQMVEKSGDLVVEKQVPESVMNETTLIADTKDATVEEMHKNAEQFDPATEKLFSYLQVITAVFNSFAHGANDVSNSIGPLAACLTIYETGDVMKEAQVPAIALVLGGVGLVVGLVCLGYKVMASMGVNMVTVTPSRGFTIELGAALIILMGSALGIPLSTTHCKVGSTVGVGIAEGKNGVNWKLLYGVFIGWIVTLVICALTTGLLFALVVRFIE